MIESWGRHVGICFDPMIFDSMLSFLVKACDAMVKVNYLSNKFWIQKYFPRQPSFPQMLSPNKLFFISWSLEIIKGRRWLLGCILCATYHHFPNQPAQGRKKRGQTSFWKSREIGATHSLRDLGYIFTSKTSMEVAILRVAQLMNVSFLFSFFSFFIFNFLFIV